MWKYSINGVAIGIAIALSSYRSVAQAQITPDNSLGGESSTVVPDSINGIPSDRLEGGATRGSNLFHSFQDFNVDVNRGAYFANPADISNIFSRVTGANISQIDGTLGVLGNANLFLINPNGIVFGENASLDLRGSFFASSADSLLFDDFAYSASNPQAPPLLEISIPIGLSFRDNPGAIASQSNSLDANGNPVGLQVDAEQSLTLVGGDIDLTGGLTAPGGKVELGAVASAGTVNINENGLTFANNLDKGNVSISNTRISVNPLVSGNGGEIAIAAGDIALDNGSILDASNLSTEGNAGNVSLLADNDIAIANSSGILSNIGEAARGNVGQITLEANTISLTAGSQLQARFFANEIGATKGKISLLANDAINIIDGSAIFANNEVGAIADSSDIDIAARTLSVSNNAVLNADNLGQGNAGNIDIQVEENLSVVNNVRISSNIGSSASGNVGTIELTADSISVEDSQLQAGFFAGGQGTEATGAVSLQANDAIAFNNASIFANNEPGAIADTVDVELLANSIFFNNSTLSTSNNGIGNAGSVVLRAMDGEVSFTNSVILTDSIAARSGNIELSGQSLLLTDGSSFGGFATNNGGAGNVAIETTDFVTLDRGSDISVFSSGTGAGGDVTINSARLNVLNESSINGFVLADSSAGRMAIATTESVTIDNASQLFLSTDGRGNAGSLALNTKSLNITRGSQISSTTFAEGNGGNLNINADAIEITGTTADGFTASRIDASTSGTGAGGNIAIDANSLTIEDGSGISAFTFGNNAGIGGNITLNIEDSLNISGFRPPLFPSSIDSETNSNSDAGNINITTANLRLSDGAKITASTTAEGTAGDINILADSIAVSGFIPDIEAINSQIASQSITSLNQSVGNAGNITISTDDLLVRDRGEITVSGVVGGLGTASAGNLAINADVIELDNRGTLNAQTFGGEGNINLSSQDIFLADNSSITTNAFGASAGGNITIDTENLVAFPNENSDISANAENSFGGRVTINATGIFGTEFQETSTLRSDITATSQLGAEFNGEVAINTPEVDPTSGLIELPASVGDASDQISQNPCQQGVGSQFIVTGKGGLPPTVNESLNSESARVDLIEPVASTSKRAEERGSRGAGENQPTEALPAMGWVFNERGEVTLTAYSTSVNQIQRTEQKDLNTCKI